MNNLFTRTVPNTLASLASLAGELNQFMAENQQPDNVTYIIGLALEEMVTNIIKYGYDDKDEHEIVVRLALENDYALLTLEDNGHEFNPLARPEPDISQEITERPIGGLGIHLVRQMSSAMTYRRVDGRNILDIRANTTPAAPQA